MIETLSRDTALEIARLGGKGCGLVRLMRAGFRVPETWYLPADRQADAERLAARLEAFATDQPEMFFAVRSSASEEDRSDASFAGIYTSVLGVRGGAALRQAVRLCAESLQSPQARAYCEAQGLPRETRMAVLIQRMLDPEVAGVLLTANPQRAFANEIVIEAAYGTGEGVASGRADPDHLVLDRRTGELRQQRIGDKKIALHHRTGPRPSEEPVPEAARARLCLDTRARRELFELAERAASSLGPRLDLEWAFERGALYLLQVRSITGLAPEEPAEVWTRRFGDEYMADPTTPSGSSFLVRWIQDYTFSDIARRLGRDDMLSMEPLRCYNGHVYLSGRYARAIVRGIPRRARAVALRGWFTPLWDRHVQAEPFSPLLFLKSIVLSIRDPHAPMSKNLACLARHAERVMGEVAPRLGSDYTRLSDDELAADLVAADEVGSQHFRVIRWGMGQHAPALHFALQSLIRRWLAEDGLAALCQQLLTGLPRTRTGEINRDIWRLAESARAEPELMAGLRAEAGEAALRRASSGESFWRAFDGFLARHGHRGATRDVSQPRWREAPELVLALVRAQLAGEVSPPDPEELERASRTRRERVEREVMAALGRTPAAWLRRRILSWVCERARAFAVYREDQRYYLDVILAQLRNLLLEHGRRLERAGLIGDRRQVFLLEADELRALFAARRGSDALRPRLVERGARYEKWRHRLPATFLFDGIETEGEIVEGDPIRGDGASADGLGASRGLAVGRARVLGRVAALGEIEPGEILVTKNIDPGWTSIFPLLGGLISETGGLLSHGALLAREYGIPAVMGVRAATSRFETGMRLAIDGTRGTVEPR